MKQRIALLTGLTAVFLLILLTSCTTPTTPEAIVATAVPPTPTPQPTATTSTGSVQATAPTATPEPTATPTAAEQANQLLLNNGRFTTLLDELSQEIGRGLSDAEQAQVLALARALWLPGQLDESDWLPDPAGVTLHWRPALDGREGPVLRVVETQPDSPYAAGAVIFWQGERLLTLTPSQPGFNIMYDQSASTWVETDTNGQLIRFVDNTNPDSDTYLKWVVPQDLDEDGRFSIFMIQDTDPRNGDAGEYYWTNGGEPVRITTGPGNVPIADFLTANPGHTLSEQDGQLAIIDGNTLLFTYDGDTWLPAPETHSYEQLSFFGDRHLVFAPFDSRGIIHDLPSGINQDHILPLNDLLEMARKNGIEPTHACSTEDSYSEAGYHQIIATIIGTDTYARTTMVGNRQITVKYDGFWFQSCGLTKDDEGISRIVSIIFYVPFDANFVDLVGEKPWEEWHLYRDFFNWDPETGTAKSTRISRTTLRDNVHDYLGSFAVMSRVPRFPENNKAADIFAQLTHPNKNGHLYNSEEEYNLEELGMTPFSGPIALVKQ